MAFHFSSTPHSQIHSFPHDPPTLLFTPPISSPHLLHFSSHLLPPWKNNYNNNNKKNSNPIRGLLPSHPLSLPFPSPIYPKTFLPPPPRVSLQDPSPQTSLNPSSPDAQQAPEPEAAAPAQKPAAAPFKNSIWVNPNSPRAAHLRRSSSESRYARLAGLSKTLDSCDPTAPAVAAALAGLGDSPSEADAVVVLNGMENSAAAVLALRWLQSKIVKIKKEVILYNVTMKVLRKCRDWDGLQSLWDEMLERGVKPDNVTFSTAISCARLCNLPAKAVEWYERMPEFGCSPDDVTYSAMIDAYGRSGNVEMALRLYDSARSDNRKLDPVTFATVIRVHSASGNFDGALRVYAEMKALGVEPNLVAYNTLLDVVGRAGRPWQAKAIYKEMVARGLSPTRATLAALLRAYSKARYAEDALGVYRQMKERGMEMNVVLHNMLLSMCADIGSVDEAVEIFEEMKRSPDGCRPDSWSYSSLITAYSCSGRVDEAERMLDEMLEAGFEPNIFVLTSIIQCYGKARRTGDAVRAFNRLLELGITPDDRFCGCLLNVLTLTPTEDLRKVIDCIDRANVQLGSLVKLLVDEGATNEDIKQQGQELLSNISGEVKKAYCNCLIDLCVNHNQMERACVLLDLALRLEIYTDLQSKSPTQWSLHVKSLSLGAALTALHVWMNDLSKVLQNGEELPPLLGIHTGHGKHKYSEKGLASVFESHLRDLSAPFHEAPDKFGWFLTTNIAAKSWLESRNSAELVAA